MDPGGRTFSWRVEWANMDYDWHAGVWTRQIVGSTSFVQELVAEIWAAEKRRQPCWTRIVRVVEDSSPWEQPPLLPIVNPQEGR